MNMGRPNVAVAAQTCGTIDANYTPSYPRNRIFAWGWVLFTATPSAMTSRDRLRTGNTASLDLPKESGDALLKLFGAWSFSPDH